METYNELKQKLRELAYNYNEVVKCAEANQKHYASLVIDKGESLRNEELLERIKRQDEEITDLVLKENEMNKPELNEGEIYVGAIINPNGTGHHIILLEGDNDDADWQTQMDWAESIGGDLPDRVEQAMLYKNRPDQFQKNWYWSNTQSESGSAWYQNFGNGIQYWHYTGRKCRARAVRRVAL